MFFINQLDDALDRLARQDLFPVSLIISPADYDELAKVEGWPVSRSPQHISFRGVPTFQAEQPGEASVIGRFRSGATKRFLLSDLLEHGESA